MRASLDTNVIIHFYKAGLQDILFNFFDEGVFIYEQIRNIEVENHGQDVLDKVDNPWILNPLYDTHRLSYCPQSVWRDIATHHTLQMS